VVVSYSRIHILIYGLSNYFILVPNIQPEFF
jgi:hypothetical protein